MIINGQKIANRILLQLKSEIKRESLRLKLAVVLVGEDEQSKIYVKKKKEACQEISVDFELLKFSATISQKDLEEKIKNIKNVTGIVVQLPLPSHIDTDKILNLIPKEKNVEAFSPVVCALEHILKEYSVSLENKKIALLGRGRLVGIPIAKWLNKQGLKFSDETENVDIIISGVGKEKLITCKMVKQGVIIIDFGGDASEEIEEKAKLFTPKIGGVGPITVACLLQNLFKLKNC